MSVLAVPPGNEKTEAIEIESQQNRDRKLEPTDFRQPLLFSLCRFNRNVTFKGTKLYQINRSNSILRHRDVSPTDIIWL